MSKVCARGLLLLLQRTLLHPGDNIHYLGLSAPRLLVGSSLQLMTRARTENAFCASRHQTDYCGGLSSTRAGCGGASGTVDLFSMPNMCTRAAQ